jgi:hypothetical protein
MGLFSNRFTASPDDITAMRKLRRQQDEVTQIERDDCVCSAVQMLPTRWPVLQLLKQRRRGPVEVAQRTSYD